MLNEMIYYVLSLVIQITQKLYLLWLLLLSLKLLIDDYFS